MQAKVRKSTKLSPPFSASFFLHSLFRPEANEDAAVWHVFQPHGLTHENEMAFPPEGKGNEITPLYPWMWNQWNQPIVERIDICIEHIQSLSCRIPLAMQQSNYLHSICIVLDIL